MRKPVIATARKHWAVWGDRLWRRADGRAESVPRDPLFPVITITGNSDVKVINDLAQTEPARQGETLDVVFGRHRLDPGKPQPGPAPRGRTPLEFRGGDWLRGLIPV